MNRILGTLIFIACGIASYSVHAQVVTRATDTAKKTTTTARYPYNNLVKPKAPKPITHEASIGLRLNSNGWSGYIDYGRARAKNKRQIDMFHNVRLWQLELAQKYSPKEEMVTTEDAAGNSNKYKYGKINNFSALKVGYGRRTLLVGKPETGTVSMHWVNVLGVSLGLEKPYYVNTYSDPDAIKFTEATSGEFLNQGVITGRAGYFSKGLNEMKFIPGGHFKSAIHFDFATDRKSVLGVETGFNIEYYSSEIKLMANQPGTPYFFDIFVAIQFGKRW